MIGERIREVRMSKGIKANFLADSIGKSPEWIHRIETGKTQLPADLLKPIANVLSVTVGFLFNENILESRIFCEEQAATSA